MTVAVMWKGRNPVEVAQDKLPLTAKLHREAGKRGFSGIPKLSSIDKRWFMEVDRVELQGDRYVGTHFNVAFGTGDTPLEAAARGYAMAMPDFQSYVILALLEAVMPLLERRASAMRKLDVALEDLTGITRSLSVPPRGITVHANIDPFRGRYDEDDDL